MPETAEQYAARLLSYVGGRDAMKLLQAAVRKLERLVRGLTKRQLTRRPAPGKWSIAEILAHLADDELVVGYRMRMILSSNGIHIQAFDQDVWASSFQYSKRDPRESLEALRLLRRQNMALLKSTPGPMWNNYGIHQERGRETIARIVKLQAGHDLNHMRQIERIRNRK